MEMQLGPKSVEQTKERLAELLGMAVDDLHFESASMLTDGLTVDAIIVAGHLKFLIEWQASGTTASVSKAIHSLRRAVDASKQAVVPIFVTRYLGTTGQTLCEEAGIGWLDLSGNARLIAPGLRIIVEGKPNLFKRPGRPKSLFAPKSSRIARHLLIHAGKPISQRELANATEMDEGFTSRIVRQLIEQELVLRTDGGDLRLSNYNTMLDAWHEAYDFSKHRIVRAHIATRSGEETLKRVAERLGESSITWAATGLSGAWLVNPFASFRLATFFVSEIPKSLESLGLREEPRGENVWLVVPNDQGVFDGADDYSDIRCVHPAQIYVDLKGHPERASEAAEDLRARILHGDADAE